MICANKQNAARSGTEQAADLTKTFKIMQSLQKKVSVSDVPIHRHPMKKLIHSALKGLMDENRLVLKPTKKNAIIDFVASVPDMTSKAVTRDNVIHGFKENGMIDSKLFRFPDFDKMLATCRKDPTDSEYQLCIDSFPHLFKIYQEKGHVDDEVFEQLGFPMDRDVDGTNVSLIRALTIAILYNIHNTLDDILERIR